MPNEITGPANGTGVGFALALNPTTAEQAMKTAEWMAKSDLVPKAYHGKPHDIVIAAAMGARLGLDPFSALAGIAVVYGRPTLWGDSMLAVCQLRPDWGGMTVDWDGAPDALACTVTILRKGQQPYAATFSVADAKKAGLWGKSGPWTHYPKRMLEMRARSYALRGSFADALAGFHAREEVEDEPRETEVVSVRDLAESAPVARRRKAPEPVQDSSPVAEDSSPASPAEPAQAKEPASIPPMSDVQTKIEAAVEALGDKLAREVMAPIAGMFGVKRIVDCPEDRRAEMLAAMDAAIEKAAEKAERDAMQEGGDE